MLTGLVFFSLQELRIFTTIITLPNKEKKYFKIFAFENLIRYRPKDVFTFKYQFENHIIMNNRILVASVVNTCHIDIEILAGLTAVTLRKGSVSTQTC